MSHFRLTRPDSLSIDRLDNLDAESPFHGWLQSKKRNRNEAKRNKQKRNETQQKRNRIKQKRNEAKQKNHHDGSPVWQVAVQNSSRSVLVWSIRTKQSINSKLHLMPRKSEFLLWKIPGALIQFVDRKCYGNQRCEYTSLWKPNSFLKPVGFFLNW